jgi:hypothetical protein
MGAQAGQLVRLEKDFDSATKKLEKLELQLDTAPSDMQDALYRRIRAARETRDSAHLGLMAAREVGDMTTERLVASSRSAMAWLTSLRDAISDPSRPAPERRRALQRILERVEVFTKPAPLAKYRSGRVIGRQKRRLSRLRLVPLSHSAAAKQISNAPGQPESVQYFLRSAGESSDVAGASSLTAGAPPLLKSGTSVVAKVPAVRISLFEETVICFDFAADIAVQGCGLN